MNGAVRDFRAIPTRVVPPDECHAIASKFVNGQTIVALTAEHGLVPGTVERILRAQFQAMTLAFNAMTEENARLTADVQAAKLLT